MLECVIAVEHALPLTMTLTESHLTSTSGEDEKKPDFQRHLGKLQSNNETCLTVDLIKYRQNKSMRGSMLDL